jgi:hypothetical protein
MPDFQGRAGSDRWSDRRPVNGFSCSISGRVNEVAPMRFSEAHCAQGRSVKIEAGLLFVAAELDVAVRPYSSSFTGGSFWPLMQQACCP